MAAATEGVRVHRRWRRSLLAGSGCGVVAGGLLEWYFNWGPEADSVDAGAAHGILLMLIGAPTTWLMDPVIAAFPAVVSRTLLVLAVGVSWGLVWAAVSMLRAGRENRV